MTVEKRASAFFIVRCDRCGREQKLGDERTVAKYAEAVRVFAGDAEKFDDARAALMLAYLVDFAIVGSDAKTGAVHHCGPCREVRRGVANARTD